jgi:hypothetical protein
MRSAPDRIWEPYHTHTVPIEVMVHIHQRFANVLEPDTFSNSEVVLS